MDGLLIDSEPFWKEAEKKIFLRVSIQLTYDMMLQTVGLKLIDVVEYWFVRFPWDTTKFPKEQITKDVIEEMILLLSRNGAGMSGYHSTITFFKDQWYKIWLNSASDYSIINVVLEKLWIRDFFDTIHSGQDEKYGKPHPGGYLSTAEKLWVHPWECLVFEDSLNGVISAKSARMKCIAVPEEENYTNQKFAIADMILISLSEFDEEKLKTLTV